ncbi:hypothetical protein D3C78_1580620 [compost metagenome]
MITPARDNITFLHQRLELDFSLQRAYEAQAEICLAVDHGTEHVVSTGIEHFDFDAWKLPVVMRDHPRHEVVSR